MVMKIRRKELAKATRKASTTDSPGVRGCRLMNAAVAPAIRKESISEIILGWYSIGILR